MTSANEPACTPAVWHQGWWQAARAVPSPNFGPRPAGMPITLAVVHSISLPPGQYGGPEIEQFFTNGLDTTAHPYFAQLQGVEVSAHFVIRRTGEVLQFVSVLDRAWHAGRSSWQGLDNCNHHSVGIELEGLEHHPFEPPQYSALAALMLSLQQAWPVHQVAGHEHIAPGRKEDPGRAFDWTLLRTLLRWPESAFPPVFAPTPSPAPGPNQGTDQG